MVIYTPRSVDGFELCHPSEEEDFEKINILVNGENRLEKWSPIEMSIIHEDEGKFLLEADSPWLGSNALIFKMNAIKNMKTLLLEFGELLPLNCSETDLSVYNPMRILDALDEEKSAVIRFGNGRIMRVNKYELRSDIIENVHIFKIPNLRVSPTYVSDVFVNAWNSAGLRGLAFKKIWESR